MIPCSFHVLYPRGVLPPATTSTFLFDSQSRDLIILSPPYTPLPHTPIGTLANIQACMYIKLSGSLALRRISKHFLGFVHGTHTHRQLQWCLTSEVIDFNAWYTGAKNEVELTVGYRLWKKVNEELNCVKVRLL